MKFYRRIWIREQGFPAELYKEIVRLKPECLEEDHFRLECQPGDEAAAAIAIQIVDLCVRSGLTQSAGGDIGTLGYDVKVYYEPEDLRCAPLLELQQQRQMFRDGDEFQRDSCGRLLIPKAKVRSTIRFASGFLTNWFVVSTSVKALLEAENFSGIRFLETQLIGRTSKATMDALWELGTYLQLPKMLNSVRNEFSVIPFYSVNEPPFRNPSPRYNQKSISEIGRFDIARTEEPLSGGAGLIISQRFYQHCLKNKIPLEVIPVCIDT